MKFLIITLIILFASSFHTDAQIIFEQKGKYGLIDIAGKIQLEAKYDTLYELGENTHIYVFYSFAKCGYAIKYGNQNTSFKEFWEITDCVYDSIFFPIETGPVRFGDDVLILIKNSQYTYKLISIMFNDYGMFKNVSVDGISNDFYDSKTTYDSIYVFPESECLVLKKENKYGLHSVFISQYDDSKGHLTDPQWDSITAYKDGYFSVWEEGKMAFYRSWYRKITPYVFDENSIFYTLQTLRNKDQDWFISYQANQPIKIFGADSLDYKCSIHDKNGAYILNDSILKIQYYNFYYPTYVDRIDLNNIDLDKKVFVTRVPTNPMGKSPFHYDENNTLKYNLQHGPFYLELLINDDKGNFINHYNRKDHVFGTNLINKNIVVEYALNQENKIPLILYSALDGKILGDFDREGEFIDVDMEELIIFSIKITDLEIFIKKGEYYFINFGEYKDRDKLDPINLKRKIVGYIKYSKKTKDYKIVRFKWMS
jgi:hypothetical protein